MFVRFFRRDICVTHACKKLPHWMYDGDDILTSGYYCEKCHTAKMAQQAQAELDRREYRRLAEAQTEEILNALKYCGRKRG